MIWIWRLDCCVLLWFWYRSLVPRSIHCIDIIMSAMASQITSITIVFSTVYLGADHRKHQSSASLAFMRGIYRWPVNSPHEGPVTRKMFPFDNVIMYRGNFEGTEELSDCPIPSHVNIKKNIDKVIISTAIDDIPTTKQSTTKQYSYL